MQYDFLKCNMVLVNITPQEFENSSISIYTQSDVEGQKFGEPFPLQEIIKNKNQYEHVFTASEFENNVSTFWLKVPPTSYVAFFFHVPGYFNDISARGATTTQSDEIIRNIIPVLVLLISVFSIFSIVKNVRDLWQNN